MKKILLSLFVLLSFVASAQPPSPAYTPINSTKYNWLGGFFRALGLPVGDSARFTPGQWPGAGAVYYDSTDNSTPRGLYIWNGTAWEMAGGSTGLQSVLAFDPDLTSDHTTDMAGNYWFFNNSGGFEIFDDAGATRRLRVAISESGLYGNDGVTGITINDSIYLTLDDTDDTATYKPVGASVTGGLVRLNSWVGSGDGGARSIAITSANFVDATTYDDERLPGQNIRVFLNELNRYLDSTSEVTVTGSGIEINVPGFDATADDYSLVIEYVEAGRYPPPPEPPVALLFPPWMDGFDFSVIKEDEVWSTDFDYDSAKATITGAEMWVNPVTGNDANDGSEGSPKKSIYWAVNFGTANIIHLDVSDSRFFYYPEAFNGGTISRDLLIDVVNGDFANVTTGDPANITWSENATYNNVWDGVYSGTASLEAENAVDFNFKDVNGVARRLTPVASIAAVDALAGSVYADATANTFYVRTWDDREPDDSLLCLFEKNTIKSTTQYNVYLQNIRFYGSGRKTPEPLLEFQNAVNTDIRTVILDNVWVIASLADGIFIHEDTRSYMRNCIVAYSGTDGIDYRETNCYGMEENVIGYYNGYGTNDANNGSTAHGFAKVVRVNGIHKYNGGRNVHDIENSASINVNVITDSSRGTSGSDYGYGISSTGSLNTNMYFFDCITEETKGWDIRTVNGHGYFYNTNKASTTNNFVGSVTDLTGYTYDPAPIVVSATAINSTTIRVVFNEAVTATNVGWSFKKNGAAHNPTSVSGSGTTTLDFTVPTMLNTDVILRTYNSGTGDTQDAGSIELVPFTDNTVTNSI